MTEDKRGFGLYIHWPFCEKKCPYCDFNSHVRADINQQQWREAYRRELQYYASLTGERSIESIFFGGGTPSLMEPATVAAILESVADFWQIAENCEITLEANPNSVEADRFAGFRSAGINRVSVGVQALNDTDLKFLGRLHGADEAKRAVAIAARHFDRYSFDLIYARPGQSVADWQNELTEALHMAGEHLSLYQLTIEPGTPFFTLAQRGALTLPLDDIAAEMYELTQSMTQNAGMAAYEISNHARPGAESRHNLTYWRSGDCIGVGPGAHGRLTLNGIKQATRAHRAPEIWLQRVATHGHGGHQTDIIAPRQCAEEALLMGLRLAEGIPLARLETESGKPWQDMLDVSAIAALVTVGYLELTPTRLTATAQGRQRLNAILGKIIRSD